MAKMAKMATMAKTTMKAEMSKMASAVKHAKTIDSNEKGLRMAKMDKNGPKLLKKAELAKVKGQGKARGDKPVAW